MDLEHLNKSQIVLLTLLVSFVTSVATGIVTVTLLEEAPPAIAQTVNRVVERTVERVVASGQAAGAATVLEKTIVVKESDLITQAVASIEESVVRLYVVTGKDVEGKDIHTFLGLGLVIKDDGTIVTDMAALPSGNSVIIARPSGERVNATIVSRDAMTGLGVLQGATTSDKGDLAWKGAKLATTMPSLGEVVVGISGKDATRIGDGIVTALSGDSDMEQVDVLETNVPVGAIAFGSPLVNADGYVEGISTSVSRAQSENAFLATNGIIMYTTTSEDPAGEENPA